MADLSATETMAPPQRSLRQECEYLHQRIHALIENTQFLVNRLNKQVEALEQQSQTLAQQNHTLEQQNHALEQRLQALEASHKAFNSVEPLSAEPDSTSSDLLESSTAEDLTVAENSKDPSPRRTSTDDTPSPVQQQDSSVPVSNDAEHLFSPVNQQNPATPTTTNTQSTDYSVWYENGSLTSDAPDHLLTTQAWQDLLTAFANTRAFFNAREPSWPLTTNSHICIREIAQKSRKKTDWSVDAPGKFCCKRCFNTQRVCLRFNEQSRRLEALPLPEEARPEGAVWGVEWFVAAVPSLSNKAGYKGLW